MKTGKYKDLIFLQHMYIWLVWFLMNSAVRNDEVGVDCLVVDDGPHHHVDVPDGVSQGDEAVRFEEHHPRHVDSPARLQLGQAGSVLLRWKHWMKKGLAIGSTLVKNV